MQEKGVKKTNKLKCEFCNKDFEWHKIKKTCSIQCMRSLRGQKITGERHFNFKGGLSINKEFVCEFCKNKFFSKKGYCSRIPRFCSRQCFGKILIKEPTEKQCVECKKLFKCPIWSPDQKLCSMKCVGKANGKRMKGVPNPNSGDKSPSWKGGVTPQNDLIRKSIQYKEWRECVFERDKYTCVLCNKKGGKLQADHIKQFAIYPELRFNIDNGRTLCEACHKKTDTYGGQGFKKAEEYKNKYLRLSISINNQIEYDYIIGLIGNIKNWISK